MLYNIIGAITIVIMLNVNKLIIIYHSCRYLADKLFMSVYTVIYRVFPN